ncbi:MAG: hypothetical protein ACRESK_06395 [Gammaproteobacteria bacterium]
MKKTYIVLLLTLMVTGVARADFNDGVVAYIAGDYEAAYNTMISIAKTDEGNALAQYYLGMMYLKGQGVEKNYEEAGKWFRKAAENRLPQAQYRLANQYSEGEGVPRDYEFAYIWYSVGAAHQHKLSQNAIDSAKAKLSENELAEAEKMVAEFIGKYGPKPEDPQQSIASKPGSEAAE